MQTQKRMQALKVWTVLTGLVLAAGVTGEVKLPQIFSDGMVLQQGQSVPVWGTAASGERVTVSFAGQKVETVADGQGKWKVTLAPLAASAEGRNFVVSSVYGEQSSLVCCTNVVVGEVWFCSGQSNMAFTMNRVKNAAQEIAGAKHPLLRHFKVARKIAYEPLADVQAKWEETTPQTTPYQSAVAYFFGETLMKELKVPVGLINSSWGGTRIEPWTPAGHPDDLWMLQHLPAVQRAVDTPTVLWNGMVAGLVPFAIKGAIWYQGCSNVHDGDAYLEKTVCQVRAWRREWGQGDFPYFLVQLAPYRYTGEQQTFLSALQEAQARVPERVPNTGYTVINDVGNVRDIHPTDKRTVGMRMADQALDRVYGKFVRPWKTPTLKAHRVEGRALRVTFADADGLKTRDGKEPTCFELRDASGMWVRAKAVIEGCDVVLTAEGVEMPTAMRFAAQNGSTPNLVNGAGLPAGPCHCGVKLAMGAAEKLPLLKGFTCVQRIDLPVVPDFAHHPPKTLASKTGITQVAYLMEVETMRGEVQFVCTAMDAWKTSSDDFVFTGRAGAHLDRVPVKNLVVRSNVAAVPPRNGGEGGVVEFYSSNYGAQCQANPPGGDDKLWDYNDTPVEPERVGYGCFQVHDLKTRQTILAFNHFNPARAVCEIGFGTNRAAVRSGHGPQPDWTFTRNGGQYKSRRISVWVK